MKSARDELNFLITNRVPRILLTRLMGWYSGIENPRLTRLSIALWRRFGGLDLAEAKEQRFSSVQQCFTRELKPGLRPVDTRPEVLASPCDAIVGAHGRVQGTRVFQAKGFPYAIEDLLGSAAAARPYEDGSFVTLRLTSAMYHRFHAPHDGTLEHVTYIAGDAWNVNPPAVARIERLYCRNERAALRYRLASGEPLAIVAVAAILVASIRLHALPARLHLRYRGPNELPCDARYAKGAELGWFEHGSTIVVFAPPGFAFAPGVASGGRIAMGRPLLVREGGAA
jgi:phosphatidylserine decarboxylase